ncbi:PrsW family intramembrane metalloprotease [Candidatus Kaiserbacteria bacterium]|nr:PrsW family intramembrane metalloprotease [Candidatus Kaiserbacteria bacterium]
MESPVLFVALLGGLLPALLWLTFWLLEDRCQPEPKRYLFLCFVAGAAGVYLALQLERLACSYLIAGGICPTHPPTLILFSWAAIEEVIKFGAAYLVALRLRVFDEPLDAVIYLVTAALGFSAFENALFLLTPLQDGEVLKSIITGDLRFIGATLLHSLSSATIGVALALAFYKGVAARRVAALVGLILAITLHTLFNFFILGSSGGATFWIFLCIWFGIVVLLFMTEQVKQPARDYC